jgi:hypothetical protein
MCILLPFTIFVSAYSACMNKLEMAMRHSFTDSQFISVIRSITMLTLSQMLGLGDTQKVSTSRDNSQTL